MTDHIDRYGPIRCHCTHGRRCTAHLMRLPGQRGRNGRASSHGSGAPCMTGSAASASSIASPQRMGRRREGRLYADEAGKWVGSCYMRSGRVNVEHREGALIEGWSLTYLYLNLARSTIAAGGVCVKSAGSRCQSVAMCLVQQASIAPLIECDVIMIRLGSQDPFHPINHHTTGLTAWDERNPRNDA